MSLSQKPAPAVFLHTSNQLPIMGQSEWCNMQLVLWQEYSRIVSLPLLYFNTDRVSKLPMVLLLFHSEHAGNFN